MGPFKKYVPLISINQYWALIPLLCFCAFWRYPSPELKFSEAILREILINAENEKNGGSFPLTPGFYTISLNAAMALPLFEKILPYQACTFMEHWRQCPPNETFCMALPPTRLLVLPFI